MGFPDATHPHLRWKVEQALRMYSNGMSMRSPEFFGSWHDIRLDQASWQEQVREVGGAVGRRQAPGEWKAHQGRGWNVALV